MTTDINTSPVIRGVTRNETTNAAEQKFNADFDSFLTLLTAQIRHQDPLAPMDSTQFVSQLAQLTQVEQTVKTNTNLETILSVYRENTIRTDANLLNRNVYLTTNHISLESGSSEFNYALGDNAESVKITIKDADGNVVREMTGPGGTGRTPYKVVWDGKNDEGTQLSDGAFTVHVKALDAKKNEISWSAQARTRVLEVGNQDGLSFVKLSNGETVETALIEKIAI